ncbi:unnamed protein product, partial [Rotaria sp. Silwood1]
NFCAALFKIPLAAIAFIGCRLNFSYVGCVLKGFIAYFGGFSNMYILSLISLDRYGVKASCSIKSKKKRSLNVISYTITIFIFVYLIQIIIIIVTNVRNFHLVRKRRLLTTIRLNESHSQRQYLLEYRITYTIIFIIGSGYILVWTPYATVADLGF